MSFVINIHDYSQRSRAFRDVISTNQSQLVTMYLKSGEDIGMEVHKELDQDIVITSGKGTATLDGKKVPISKGDLIRVYAGTEHNIEANEGVPITLFAIYSKQEHEDRLLKIEKLEE